MASSLRRLASNSAVISRSAIPRAFSTESALVETKPGEIGTVSGIPQEHLRRKVMIFSPARTATQQGAGKVGRWKINFLSTQKWENPLMGWTSTGDPYANVGDSALSFDSQEAAVSFAERHGWEYTALFAGVDIRHGTVSRVNRCAIELFSCIFVSLVKKHHTPLLKVKAYADNFKWKGPPASEAS
ncbi:hypothetical protein SASPL_142037 [Salvia splendens]|uniref:NADH dehydrogenase [ubiquinone] iron-sulfur protein 4, mitochondrial n=1 Tax=Salvia splendens TaxID=180675 RepID=A0A8X8WKX4_SALSN|nr:hypothetical protein SASPL_142037 [Salvia splendens]